MKDTPKKSKTPESPKKKSGFLRILIIVMIVAVAITAVSLAVRGGKTGGLGALWQSITGGDELRELSYENASGGVFGSVGDGFAVMAQSGLRVFDSAGGEKFTRLFNFDDPAMVTAGKYGVAWDVGGNSVIFFSEDNVIYEFETESRIVSASVNQSGYMCVCTEESGYLGSVTVYNPKGTDIYKWYSGQARVLSAQVRKNSELMVLTVGEGGSGLVLMPLDSEEETARYSFAGLIIDAAFQGSDVVAVTTGSLVFLNGSLEETGAYDFAGRYLDRYKITDDYVALELGDYQVGGDRYVVTVDTKGEELGSALMSDEILSLDAGKDGVAVLYSGEITVYNRDMSSGAAVECAAGTESVVLRKDGSVVAAGAFSAYVYSVSRQ